MLRKKQYSKLLLPGEGGAGGRSSSLPEKIECRIKHTDHPRDREAVSSEEQALGRSWLLTNACSCAMRPVLLRLRAGPHRGPRKRVAASEEQNQPYSDSRVRLGRQKRAWWGLNTESVSLCDAYYCIPKVWEVRNGSRLKV